MFQVDIYRGDEWEPLATGFATEKEAAVWEAGFRVGSEWKHKTRISPRWHKGSWSGRGAQVQNISKGGA